MTGEAEGPTRARTATLMALRPILLDNLRLTTAQRALVHVTAGPECGLNEVSCRAVFGLEPRLTASGRSNK